MKLVIFSGTSDGNKLCQWLGKQHMNADVYVATEYGKQVMSEIEGINVHIGRLNSTQMAEIIDFGTLLTNVALNYILSIDSESFCWR